MSGICTWVLTTNDGLKFYFGNTSQSKEYTYFRHYGFTTDIVAPFGGTNDPTSTQSLVLSVYPTTSIDLEDQYTFCPDASELVCEDSHISSWYLTKIESPADGASILFTYVRNEKGIDAIPSFSEEFVFPERFSYVDCEGVLPPEMGSRSKTALLQPTKYDNVRLSAIESDYTTLEFHEVNDRVDLIGGTRLSEIVVKNSGNYYKKIVFDNDQYFTSDPMDDENCWQYLLEAYDDYGHIWSDHVNSDNNTKRLKLESVVVKGLNNEALPDYSFEYNDEQLPPKTSMSVDFWGFANGNASGGAQNLTMVPTYYFHDQSSLSIYEPGCSTITVIGQCDPVYFRGGDRRANTTYAVAATLEGILLPTGATHRMLYGLNEFQNSLPKAFSSDIVMDRIGVIDASNYSDESAFQTTIVVKANGSDCQKTPVYLKANWNYQNNTECETYPRVRVSKSGFSQTAVLTPANSSPPFYYSHLGSDNKPFQIPAGKPTFVLDPGTYTMEIVGDECCWDVEQLKNCDVYFTIYVQAYDGVHLQEELVGGVLRVNELTTNVGNGDKKIEYVYESEEESTSGILHSVPIFMEKEYWANYVSIVFDDQDQAHFNIVKMSSNSKTPLTNFFASALVGYSRVLKKNWGDEEFYGNEVLSFYNELPQRDDDLHYESIGIPFFFNEHNGDLLASEIFDSEDAKIYEMNQTYSVNFNRFDWIWGMMPKTMYQYDSEILSTPCDAHEVTFIYYALVPQWHKLESKVEKFWGTDGSGPLTKTTAIDYNETNFEIKSEEVSCGTDSKLTEYFYASDLTSGTLNGLTGVMITNFHMTGVPLEKLVNNGSGGGQKVAYFGFSSGPNTLVLPSKYYRRNGSGWQLTDEIEEYEGRFPSIIDYKADAQNTKLIWANGLIDKKYYPSSGAGRVWDYTYNTGRHLSQIVDNDGVVSSFEYDNLWRLKSKTLKNGRIKEDITYDYARTGDANQIISLLNYPEASHEYLEDVNLRNVTTYDGIGRVVSVNKEQYSQDKRDYITGQDYNAIGQKVAETDPAVGGTSVLTYEKSILNRLTEILPPATPVEHAIEIVHGISGNFFTEARTDENGHTTTTYKDIFDRVRKVDQEGIVTEYEYNDRDQVTFIYPPGGVAPYEFTYYPNGLLDTKLVPDKGTVPYKVALYNDQDQIRIEELPNGTTINTSYHPTYNHLVVDKKADGVIISEYEYVDADNHDWVKKYYTEVIGTGDILPTKYSGHDDLGRPALKTQHFMSGVSSVSYEYDDADNIVNESTFHFSSFGGANTRYTHDYDRGLRVNTTKASITGMPGSEYYGKFTYDHRDLLVSNEVYDGLYSTNYTYHQRGWMESINGVNSTFKKGEKPNCIEGPYFYPVPPPGCVGPIHITNVTLFYDCLDLV